MRLYVGGGLAKLACPASKDGGDHTGATFVWQDGSAHADHHAAELRCICGRKLVHAGGTDPWKHPHREVEGEPHGA